MLTNEESKMLVQELSNGNTIGKEINRVFKTYYFLKSRSFFWISLFLVLFGIVFYFYFFFRGQVESQNLVLEEIRSNQEGIMALELKVESLEASNKELMETNIKLVSTICILQKQISSLGVKPEVEPDTTCSILE